MICSRETVELDLVNTPWREDGFMCTRPARRGGPAASPQ